MEGGQTCKTLKKVSSLAVKGTPPYKIELRISKMIERLSVRIREMLPLILSDDTKKEEIHILEKKLQKIALHP